MQGTKCESSVSSEEHTAEGAGSFVNQTLCFLPQVT